MSRPIYSIRFPLVKEKTGRRTGPHFRLMPDQSGLYGARFCACGMVRSAINYRDTHISSNPIALKIDRLNVRIMALWARVFAGHIEATDPRLVMAEAKSKALFTSLMAPLDRFLNS